MMIRSGVAAVFLVLAACGRGTPPAGEVVFGTVTVKEGSVPANVLTGWLNDLHPAMEGCYAAALAKSPKTGGAIHLALRGEQTGTTTVVTENTIEDPSLTQCVTEALRGVKADSTGAFAADWSVDFSPKG